VELSVSPGVLHNLSTDIIAQLPIELLDKQHTIWEFLKSTQKTSAVNLVVIGPPGSGKTTLLKHIVLVFVYNCKLRKRMKLNSRLPILLFLREHIKTIVVDPAPTLVQVIREQLSKWEIPDPPGWVERQLKTGRMLIMFDGLDEVADPEQREILSRWVQQQMKNFGNNQFILSSRPYGYKSNPLNGVIVLEIKPFHRKQIESFVERWYHANEVMSHQKDDPGVQIAARKGSKDLLDRIFTNNALAELAVNPLLLTMIATVHRYKSSLPGRRVELYGEICDVFLGNHQRAKGLALELTPAQKQCVLQPLAYYLMTEKKREIDLKIAEEIILKPLQRVKPDISAQSFMKMIEESSGVLIERESGVYAFAHLTFQEYLTSVYIIEQKLEKELLSKINDTWWHEVIRLYVAKTDATTIIKECLENCSTYAHTLTLTIECMDEAREVDPGLRSQLQQILEKGIEDADPERRRIVAEALLALRLKQMVRIDDRRYIDLSYITNAEYQLFLDEMRAKGEYYQPDHWKGYQFETGHGRESVVGIRPSDAETFCRWLTERESGGWFCRLPVIGKNDEELACASEPFIYIIKNEAHGYWAKSGEKNFTFKKERNDPLSGISVEIIKKQMNKDFDRVRNLDYFYNFVYALTLTLVRDLDHALDFSLALDRVRALALDHVRALDRALELIRTLEFDLHRARALDRARALEFDLDRARALARALEFDLAFARARARVFDRARAFDLNSINDIRAIALYISISFLYLQEVHNLRSGWISRKLRFQKRDSQDLLLTTGRSYLDLYIDLVILEKRINGELPAFEGIRIVKEAAEG
jgi:DNA polymerase III delta prime subunit